jgi:long-chain acyl-CoA synthetase
MGLPLAQARNAAALRDRAPVQTERSAERIALARTPPLVPHQSEGSLADLPFSQAKERPDAATFARRTPEGKWRDVTARAFADEVTAAARGLIHAGVGPGDRVALMSRTCYEWTLLDFAVWAAGASLVPIYPTASAQQAAWIIEDCEAVALIAEDGACAATLAAALRSAGRAELPVWRLDEGAVDDLTARGALVPEAEVEQRRAMLTPGAEATVIYTSGTTGRPKGAALTHGNFLDESANCVALLYPVFQAVAGQSASTLLFLPLAHVLGRMIEVSCVRAGIKLGHSPSIKPDELRPDLASFGATFLVGVPYLFEKIHHLGRIDAQALHAGHVYDRAERIAVRWAEAAFKQLAGEGPGPSAGLRAAHRLYDLLVYRKVRKALGGRVRYAISGGSALSPELLLFFGGAGIVIYEGYGLTESTGPTTVNPPLRPRPGTVGPPVPGTAVRIAADGEIELQGPQIFRGYQGTGGVDGPGGVDGGGGDSGGGGGADGWFATGDLGRLDEDGYLTITGRKKDILVTNGGKNVSPGPLEDRLRAHPLISQCLVIGDGRSYIAALVTLDAEAVEQYVGRLAAGAREFPVDTLGSAHPEVQVDSAVLVPRAVLAEIARALAGANAAVSRAESIRRARVVEGDFTEERGLLTPSLKTKRQAVMVEYKADVEALYPAG